MNFKRLNNNLPGGDENVTVAFMYSLFLIGCIIIINYQTIDYEKDTFMVNNVTTNCEIAFTLNPSDNVTMNLYYYYLDEDNKTINWCKLDNEYLTYND